MLSRITLPFADLLVTFASPCVGTEGVDGVEELELIEFVLVDMFERLDL